MDQTIITYASTRPDFLRIFPLMKKLDKYYKNIFVWGNQNYDPTLSTQFFEEFKRKPDISVHNEDYNGLTYIGNALTQLETIFKKIKPKCIIMLGDTNGTLAACIVAKKLGITIFHMEAGNRSYDLNRVPEEVNRRMIDSISDWHLCYTQRAREQLLLEGKRPDRCIVIGNPIIELIELVHPWIGQNGIDTGYFLSTIHRKENIDDPNRLLKLLTKLDFIGLEYKYKVKLSYHPTLKAKMKEYHYSTDEFENIEFITPTNFKGFMELETGANCIITDSGTVPEEASYLNVPCVLLRFSTERPELLENDSMIVCPEIEGLNLAVKKAIENNYPMRINEYHNQTSSVVLKLIDRLA